MNIFKANVENPISDNDKTFGPFAFSHDEFGVRVFGILVSLNSNLNSVSIDLGTYTFRCMLPRIFNPSDNQKFDNSYSMTFNKSGIMVSRLVDQDFDECRLFPYFWAQTTELSSTPIVVSGWKSGVQTKGDRQCVTALTDDGKEVELIISVQRVVSRRFTNWLKYLGALLPPVVKHRVTLMYPVNRYCGTSHIFDVSEGQDMWDEVENILSINGLELI